MRIKPRREVNCKFSTLFLSDPQTEDTYRMISKEVLLFGLDFRSPLYGYRRAMSHYLCEILLL